MVNRVDKVNGVNKVVKEFPLSTVFTLSTPLPHNRPIISTVIHPGKSFGCVSNELGRWSSSQWFSFVCKNTVSRPSPLDFDTGDARHRSLNQRFNQNEMH